MLPTCRFCKLFTLHTGKIEKAERLICVVTFGKILEADCFVWLRYIISSSFFFCHKSLTVFLPMAVQHKRFEYLSGKGLWACGSRDDPDQPHIFFLMKAVAVCPLDSLESANIQQRFRPDCVDVLVDQKSWCMHMSQDTFSHGLARRCFEEA